jgi:hypothetical protein
MIKAAGKAGAEPLVVIGLSGENMTRLMAKEPIKFDLAELGLPSTVVIIVGGRTENDIIDDLQRAGLRTDKVSM